jgi:hypothetical protein
MGFGLQRFPPSPSQQRLTALLAPHAVASNKVLRRDFRDLSIGRIRIAPTGVTRVQCLVPLLTFPPPRFSLLPPCFLKKKAPLVGFSATLNGEPFIVVPALQSFKERKACLPLSRTADLLGLLEPRCLFGNADNFLGLPLAALFACLSYHHRCHEGRAYDSTIIMSHLTVPNIAAGHIGSFI